MDMGKLRTVESDRNYLDYVRDAQALRSRYVGELMTNAWRSLTALLRSNSRRPKRFCHTGEPDALRARPANGFRSRATRSRLA
jgi:hypothetical protein